MPPSGEIGHRADDPFGEFRQGQEVARGQVADVEAGVAALVDDPGEVAAIAGEVEPLDVPVRRLDPAQVAGLDVDEPEPEELAPEIGADVEAGAVRRPGAGVALGGVLALEELALLAGSEIDQDQVGVGIGAGLDRGELAPARRPIDRLIVAVAEERPPRLRPLDITEDNVAVGGIAVVAAVGDRAAVRRPGVPGEVVLDLRLGRQRLRSPAGGGDQVELMELVAVMIGGEENLGAVRRPGDFAHRVVGEDRELLRVAAGG